MAVQDYNSVVQAIYVSYFGRPADTFGFASFKAQLDGLRAPTSARALTDSYKTNADMRSLIDSFGASAESAALYGNDATGTTAFVTAIYNNLLNRNPDFEGLTFWTNAINSGDLTRANASLAIMAGATDNMTPQGRLDAAIVAKKVSVAGTFTAHIDNGPELQAYNGDAAAATARAMLAKVYSDTDLAAFTTTVDDTIARLVQDSIPSTVTTLAVGVDAHAGTYANDTFNAFSVDAGGAAATTLSASDSINGSDGYDTLNIFATATVNNVQAGTVNSIETVNIHNTATTTAEMYGKGAIGASMFTGATAIWQIGSKAQDVVGVSNETTVGFRGTAGQTLSVSTDAATASIALDGVGASAGNQLDINVIGSNVTKVVLAGTVVGSNTTVDLDVLGSTKVSLVDALGLAGSLVISTDMLADGGTIKLGTGRDVVHAGSKSTATNFESIGTMEKADPVSMTGDSAPAIAARADADVIAFGAGSVVANANSAVTSGTITNGVLTFAGGAPSTIGAAIAIADAAAETAGEVVVFEYLGSSYVFQQAATDIVVRLTGTVGITNLVEFGADSNTFFIV